ncbi:type 4a pilus biogenesis protein PilO [Vibrio breoganii]|uniref:MSHA biogenesis protein MshJ n=1 Tax=Vibrio breoganii TaxID=553239 RepID=A0AAJ5EJG0_9VIBR|nr:type 4a pilus biogenesis protein PilO [Vibrio breoganii]ANO33824.1 MSHA biogenesis protein MshJ [Vibrio breoganii]MDN3717341.1 type 4a pilus biogenesis protein PilO [Vibrio breoganii]NMO74295.1 type 4a pilus biogenesis protein PilO [Vibrio breoganii]NMR71008.1 type 4a pilus biogenesis protein PilO [Vibrio breoganii]OCH73541.1 MSHA biogenesis protein MshJ [Vibrio breoganii]
MKEQWLLFCDRFADLSDREKWLVSIGGWVGILLISLTFMLDPASEEKGKAQRNLEREMSAVQMTQADIDVLIAKLKRDPDAEIDQKLTELTVQNQQLSEELSEVVDSLIAPSQMAQLLETVLGSSGKLKLESLQSLPAESITKTSDSSGYFLHPVRITISGRYFDIKDYLATLEDMPVKYFWRSFDYKVQEYPKAELVLEVYTLGTRQEFISG